MTALQKIYSTTALLFFITSSSIFSQESYLGLGGGLQFDLGGLGKTIAIDGLSSGVGNPTLQGHSIGSGCPDVQCQREVPGYFQEVIVPENKLIALERATAGIIKADTNGPMTGFVLNVFYEKEINNFFYRGGVDYARKVMGGDTSSELAGVNWYEVKWDYKAIYVPLYIGLKAKYNGSSVYGGAGINYFQGGWSFEGTNMGDIPTYLLGVPMGLNTVIDGSGSLKGGSVYKEHIKFKSKGLGFNMVIGIDVTLASGNKTFFEIDHKFSGGYASDHVDSAAAIDAVAPYAVYPQNLSGSVFRFGYKLALSK